MRVGGWKEWDGLAREVLRARGGPAARGRAEAGKGRPAPRASSPLLALAGALLGVALGVPSAALADCPGLPPPGPDTVRVGFFSNSLPMLAAQANEFFEHENLTVATFQVSSSVQMFQCLRDGQLDIALSSADNPLNYRMNSTSALGAPLDAEMLLGTDLGLDLSLVSQPQDTSIASLAGKRIGVDSPSSGYAFVLYQMLAANGLPPGSYQVVVVGGTPLRYQALLAGTIDATLLNSDSYLRAIDAGMNALAPVSTVAVPYLGGVASARQSWIDANGDLAVRFIRAYIRGQEWSLDPANHADAIALLETLPDTSAALAEQIYAMLFDPTGLLPDAALSRDGLASVIALRAKWNGFQQPDVGTEVTRASGLYDLSYRATALCKLKE
jgi:ABC-type nitrate/sulfonate/bicarbonate transport system substrate-binding protein